MTQQALQMSEERIYCTIDETGTLIKYMQEKNEIYIPTSQPTQNISMWMKDLNAKKKNL